MRMFFNSEDTCGFCGEKVEKCKCLKESEEYKKGYDEFWDNEKEKCLEGYTKFKVGNEKHPDADITVEDNFFKYYCPDISEFYVGFEFEAFFSKDWYPFEGANGWMKITLNFLDFSRDFNPINLIGVIRKNLVRVKLLDQSDIERLGWKDLGGLDIAINREYKLGEYYLSFINNKRVTANVEIGSFLSGGDNKKQALFIGTIRNYNELKTLMWQLNIVQ